MATEADIESVLAGLRDLPALVDDGLGSSDIPSFNAARVLACDPPFLLSREFARLPGS